MMNRLETMNILMRALRQADKDLAHYGGQSHNDSCRCRIKEVLAPIEREIMLHALGRIAGAVGGIGGELRLMTIQEARTIALEALTNCGEKP